MTSMIHHEQRVLACVDRSHFAEYVADYAAWCGRALALPVELLHILDRHPERGRSDDHSGSLGVEPQGALLETLVTREGAENRMARELGRRFLSGLRNRLLAHGTDPVNIRMRYGELEQTLVEQEPGVELFVLGRRGESAEATGRDLGRNLERVVRALRRPILAVSEEFRPPKRVLVAFDGGAMVRRGLDVLAESPLFRSLACDLVMSGAPGRQGEAQLEAARERLAASGLAVESLLRPGDPEREIARAVKERRADLLVMGAYSHSVLRRFLRGSRTADLLRASTVPTLLLR